jgi:hypothetical protein
MGELADEQRCRVTAAFSASGGASGLLCYHRYRGGPAWRSRSRRTPCRAPPAQPCGRSDRPRDRDAAARCDRFHDPRALAVDDSFATEERLASADAGRAVCHGCGGRVDLWGRSYW